MTQVIVHPKYSNFYNDIALLKLRAPLIFGDNIKAIQLGTTELASGTRVQISGWGLIRNNGPLSGTLKFNTLSALTNAECSRRIGGITNGILCLSHSSGNGACQGDSGGPAVYNNRLVGVTNFVVGNCGNNAPDGYAKVSFYQQFIRNNSDL